MSILSDLINGKELPLSDGGKITIVYKEDSSVIGLNIGGQSVSLSAADLRKLQTIQDALSKLKTLEPKVPG
jgi:hypothetical protein